MSVAELRNVVQRLPRAQHRLKTLEKNGTSYEVHVTTFTGGKTYTEITETVVTTCCQAAGSEAREEAETRFTSSSDAYHVIRKVHRECR
jgi:hypothetical protein